MSAAGDKARFHLEQSVSELQELERKKIFNKGEITSIAAKRSAFEHQVNARGSRSSNFIRYAEFEMNLETLRQRRSARLGIKTTRYTGRRRIFFILDRATRNFPNDIALWMQYIAFARKQKSVNKIAEIMIRALRLHPTNPDLWAFAANYALEDHDDISEARSFMQRGLRFCSEVGHFWIEYARLELMYICRILERKKTLDLSRLSNTGGKTNDIEKDFDENELALSPRITKSISTAKEAEENLDQAALERLNASPAISGAIPIAIFDSAMEHSCGNESLAHQFFNMFAEFERTPSQSAILSHIIEKLMQMAPNSPSTMICFIREPVIGIQATSAEFPPALSDTIGRVENASLRVRTALEKSCLARHVVEWILSYIGIGNLDPDIRQVLEIMLERAWNQYQLSTVQSSLRRSEDLAELKTKIQAQGLRICN